MSPNNSGQENRECSKTSFWEFLKGVRKIEIPIIQRDYAQGRQGKESLREKFLKDLKDALCSDKQLEIDFVYGSEKDGKKQRVKVLKPLDGQQRLTTLWLLHWYIALRAGQLKENCEVLKRFTYETRISSREFCENLCIPKNFDSFNGEGIVDFIENQTWFYSAWKQDPTIQSMLRMLGGTGTNDGIEGVFKGGEDYKEWWKYLTSDSAPIIFYYLSLENFGLSDDLYVKMNARGKPLTPFENFKADLIGYIRERAKNSGEWGKFLSPDKDIPIDIKLDNAWADIFWENRPGKKNKSEENRPDDNKIDEIYLAFLNRFFWNEFFFPTNNIGNYVPEGLENLGDKDDTEYIEEYNFLIKDDNSKIKSKLFDNLQTILDNYCKYKERYGEYKKSGKNPLPELFLEKEWEKRKEVSFPDVFFPKWIQGNFKFIPVYKNSNGKDIVPRISRVDRVIFFALCKYFKEETVEEDVDFAALKRWMRVVCNLVSGRDSFGNPQVRDYPSVGRAIEYIDGLKSHDVYNSDWDVDKEEGEDAPFSFDGKCNEEIIKVRQILKDRGWEDKIIKAEEFAFFNGTIRFLYQGEAVKEDWYNFNVKWENVKRYFLDDEKKSGEEKFSWVKSNSAKLLKTLMCQFDSNSFDSVLKDKKNTVLNNRADSWNYYLVNKNIRAYVHRLLMLKDGNIKDIKMNPDLLPDFDKNENMATLYYLSQTNLLDSVIKLIPTSCIQYICDGLKVKACVAIKKKNSWETKGEYVLLNTKKYDFLKNSKIDIVREDNKIDGTDLHFENSNIYFDYDHKNYVRWEDRWIYLQKESGSSISEERNNSKKLNGRKKYYCFDTRGLDETEIIKKLDELKDAYEEDKKKKGKS